jgi:hypothetical protein
MEGTYDTHMPNVKYMHNFIEIPEGKTSVGNPRRRWRIILNGALKKLICGVLTGLIRFRTRTNGFFL